MKTYLVQFTKILVLSLVSAVSIPTLTFESETNYSRYTERYFKTPVVLTPKEQRCLAQAIYYEAGNQPKDGKEAVAVVIVNRVNHGRYPNTICGVVKQAAIVNEKKICQFSFWCAPKRKPVKEVWEESQEIAKRVLQNAWERDILLMLNDAVYYHADYVHPKWRHKKQFLGKIGNHLFYGEPQV